MNEALFFIQIFFTLLFVYGALKLGPSALVAWVTVQALIANLFVLKQIHLFGMEVTASDGYAIGSLLGLNVLQEFYGKKEAKQATWICFFFMTFFAFDTAQTAFITVLSPSLRLIFASMSVFFIVQLFDIRFFAFLKQKLPTVSFSIRAALALIVSQFLDTLLFSFAGLYGIVASVLDIIIVSYVIKLIVIFCFTSLVRIART